jgi:hypothetical protein
LLDRLDIVDEDFSDVFSLDSDSLSSDKGKVLLEFVFFLVFFSLGLFALA